MEVREHAPSPGLRRRGKSEALAGSQSCPGVTGVTPTHALLAKSSSHLTSTKWGRYCIIVHSEERALDYLQTTLWCPSCTSRAQPLSHVRLFATARTVARQAPLPVGFSRQTYWSGLQFPSPVDLPNPGIEPTNPASAGGFFTTVPPGTPQYY